MLGKKNLTMDMVFNGLLEVVIDWKEKMNFIRSL